MSDVTIEISFVAKREHIPLWREITEGLYENEVGNRLQDRMKLFGDAVYEKLEYILDHWPADYFYCEHWECEGNKFKLGLMENDDVDEFAEVVNGLFLLCPISELKVEVISDAD